MSALKLHVIIILPSLCLWTVFAITEDVLTYQLLLTKIKFKLIWIVCFIYLLIYYHFSNDCFLRRDRKCAESGGWEGREDLRELGVEETAIRIFYIKKKLDKEKSKKECSKQSKWSVSFCTSAKLSLQSVNFY